MKKKLLTLTFLLWTGQLLNAQTILHYWNFNTSTSETTLFSPNVSLVSGSSIVHNSGTNAGFTSIIPLTGNTTGQGFETTNPNVRNGDPAGSHLRLNNPLGGNLVFALPTTGYRDIVIKYATRRSGSGPHNQVIDYSLNGTTFTNLTTIAPVDGDPTLQTLDFTGISGAANNPDFKVRISFTQGGGGLEGNNRFDNFTLEGTPNVVSALLHYWNFNDPTTETTLLAPTVSLISGSSINALPGGTSALDVPGGTGQNFNIDNFNARNSDVSGTHLRSPVQ